MLEHGEVLAWGNNEYRQLGVDSEEPQVPVPHLVGVSGLDGHVIAVAAGTSFTGFLTGGWGLWWVWCCELLWLWFVQRKAVSTCVAT